MNSKDKGDITRILRRIETGDRAAIGELLDLVYESLKHLASRQMRGQHECHTLQATALVHESFLRMFDEGTIAARDREHLFALAACAMRSALVDHARRRGTLRRSTPGEREPLDELADSFDESPLDLITLDAALKKLAVIDPRLVELVNMHHFMFMSTRKIADLRGVSARTIERDLLTARVWLKRELR